MQGYAYVRISGYPTVALVDTRASRSTVAWEIAAVSGALWQDTPTQMSVVGHRLTGDIAEFDIEMIDCPGRATVKAFVPDKGQKFAKGVLLGMDFLQPAGLHIDAVTGEAYCPEKGTRK